MTLKLKSYNEEKEINNLYEKQFNEKLKPKKNKFIYGLYDNNRFVGYVIFFIIKLNTIKIDWIYAPGYGKILMKKLESKFKRMNIQKIILNVSIDPTEEKKIVMKRINYYINLHYKVYNIKFRQKFGPLLYMYKDI